MRVFLKLFLVALIVAVFGCKRDHLISDRTYLSTIEKSFAEGKELAKNRENSLFSVFNQKLSDAQTEALKFLFAFMPLSDLADYNGDFFLDNVDIALRAREETTWGKDIPDDIFIHYVLPCRVNNENLDSFRIVYYDEIFNRVRGKDLKEAALEINHWCHEKVSYQPSDIRTSAPMSTILSARGRCGEESTFTVAALRTVGIPARQVYTPRWAHSDDNHAWVEIWDNGKWYYMGACEPEPVLDQGWFTEPARRAMLVHTKSFGAPLGNENVIVSNRNYVLVNNLSKYAKTKTIYVKVIDEKGIPQKGAKVEYQLYNYAEFYPLACVPANEKGISRFETGLGDLLIWAYESDRFNFKKISVSAVDTVMLTLNRTAGGNYSYDLDLNVPVVLPPLPVSSPESIEQNAVRINRENIIRQKYIDSWMHSEDAEKLARLLNIDEEKTVGIIARSMGNYNEITSFLYNTPDSLRARALILLEILADKDLRDINELVLSDHLINCPESSNYGSDQDQDLYVYYILNPRIDNEIIVDWRGYFRVKLPSELIEKAYSEPSLIVQYLNENILIENEENYYKTPLTPIGVNELKVSDDASRSICFVAICRSLGIPSRLEPGSTVPQYYFNGEWNNVYFSNQNPPMKENGYLRLFSSETTPVPEYYIHFTIAKFWNGRYNTLEYDYNKKINDFPEELALTPGSYIIVTGNRVNDSKILSNITFFDIHENEHKSFKVTIRMDNSETEVSGKLDIMSILKSFHSGNALRDNIMQNGAVLVWIDQETEPSIHILNDLSLLKPELDAWGGCFMFITDSPDDTIIFNQERLKGLPENSFFGIDDNMQILNNIVSSGDLPEVRHPLILVTDRNSNIIFTSAGYRIGIGDQILKSIR